MKKDTIAAIATAMSNSGIGIVRMSGKNCFGILEKIFIPKNKNVPISVNINNGKEAVTHYEVLARWMNHNQVIL